MHILIIPSWYPTKENPISGIFFLEQAQALKKAGHQVGVIYPDRNSIRKFRFKNIRKTIQYENEDGLHTLRTRGWYWFPRIPHANASLFINDGLELFKLYLGRYGKPDILHAHSMLFGGVLASKIKQIYNIPFITTEHSTEFARGLIKPWHKQYLNEVYENTSKLLTVSLKLGEVLLNYGCPKDLTSFVPNIVNTDFFDLSDDIKENEHKFVFLTISSLVHKKGHSFLLDAFADSFRNNSNIILWIGGDGEERFNIERQAKELGIASQVILLGKLSREQVRDAMQKADVFILPSLYETFGVVVIEAMACGKPVIATMCGGPECIINDVNGILVPKANSRALSLAMEQIIKDIDNYDSKLIREDCENRFSEEVVTAQLTAIYESVLQGESRKHEG